ncbi:hypothetical protein A2U01_0091662 [Trifolium medium]|uniref:Uncharacterized protein n=1 Tax=Trifolium medium TaxID=97028 RepID=A0A392UA64_9FABA|nr:hypothetical protein [Trifolium medium]
MRVLLLVVTREEAWSRTYRSSIALARLVLVGLEYDFMPYFAAKYFEEAVFDDYGLGLKKHG